MFHDPQTLLARRPRRRIDSVKQAVWPRNPRRRARRLDWYLHVVVIGLVSGAIYAVLTAGLPS